MTVTTGPEWWFYHLERPPLAAALGPLLEKSLERDWRVLVACPSLEVIDTLDSDLWKWRDGSFLPHGRDTDDPEMQPVLLSQRTEPQNGAKVLTLLGVHSVSPNVPYQRVMVVFEDGDEATRGHARKLYKDAKTEGLSVRYFQQTGDGRWSEKKATTTQQ